MNNKPNVLEGLILFLIFSATLATLMYGLILKLMN